MIQTFQLVLMTEDSVVTQSRQCFCVSLHLIISVSDRWTTGCLFFFQGSLTSDAHFLCEISIFSVMVGYSTSGDYQEEEMTVIKSGPS